MFLLMPNLPFVEKNSPEMFLLLSVKNVCQNRSILNDIFVRKIHKIEVFWFAC